MRILLLILTLAACAPTTHSVNEASPGNADRRVGRNHYSPEVVSDPYVRDRHRAVADALRQSCRHMGEHCNLAEGAERFIEDEGGGR